MNMPYYLTIEEPAYFDDLFAQRKSSLLGALKKYLIEKY
jgi:hypothetical protein